MEARDGGLPQKLREKMELLRQGGPRRGPAGGGTGSGSSCWCWWRLFRRGAARDPRRKKAKYGCPGPATPQHGRWGPPNLQRLIQRLATWRRHRERPERPEEIPLLVLHRVQGAA
ncbi:uncharacterized protein C1orf202 homolog [Sorex fumeus]|uniref:uncharacterized protein C1orf202 homolog n=1 Tax=Sorex fumeus TaxID=62283 RepID=UPI0024AD156D|nr:uncharacterized protein C1orf202 homolog [Sorex fumeus]